jgi:hypothetical protein
MLKDNLPNDFQAALQKACLPSAPFHVEYTGMPAFDSVFCSSVAFFDAALQPINTPYTAHLLFNLAPITVFMLAEGSRTGCSAWMSPISAVSHAFGWPLYIILTSIAPI